MVKFWADWCHPCKLLSTNIKLLFSKGTYKDRVAFLDIDLEEFPESTYECNINSLPTLIFYKGGVEVYRSEGNQPASVLAGIIDGL